MTIAAPSRHSRVCEGWRQPCGSAVASITVIWCRTNPRVTASRACRRRPVMTALAPGRAGRKLCCRMCKARGFPGSGGMTYVTFGSRHEVVSLGDGETVAAVIVTLLAGRKTGVIHGAWRPRSPDGVAAAAGCTGHR